MLPSGRTTVSNLVFKVWRKILPFLFAVILVHFAKDITQDILRIKTPLDVFGDAQEDLSFLPKTLQPIYFYGLGGVSLLAEMFLLVSIPRVWKKAESSKLELWVVVVAVLLLLFFLVATFLDPRFGF